MVFIPVLWSLGAESWYLTDHKICLGKIVSVNMYYTSAGIMSLYHFVSSNCSGFDPVLWALDPVFILCNHSLGRNSGSVNWATMSIR